MVSGWDNIAEFCDVDRKTLKYLVEECCMPVHYWPNEIPVIIPEEVIHWMLITDEVCRIRKVGAYEDRTIN